MTASPSQLAAIEKRAKTAAHDVGAASDAFDMSSIGDSLADSARLVAALRMALRALNDTRGIFGVTVKIAEEEIAAILEGK